jgi:Ca2+-binding RTX toxin-like protein
MDGRCRRWFRFLFTQPSRSGRPGPRPVLRVQQLEDRTVLSAGISYDPAIATISIDGTDSDDDVVVEGTDWGDHTTGVHVSWTHDGTSTEFTLEETFNTSSGQWEGPPVHQVLFFGHDGNDSFTNNTNISAVAHGNAGNDTIQGGWVSDTLYGDGGSDTLWGSSAGTAGNAFAEDVLYGGSGYQTVAIRGGLVNVDLTQDDGNDQLYGGVGKDRLYGQEGNDTLVGGEGNDSVDGGPGNDQLFGDARPIVAGRSPGFRAPGADLYPGTSYLFVKNTQTFVYGVGPDDPQIPHNDVLHGGTGDDLLAGNQGNDHLFGEEGNDHLFGEAGADVLFGGSGFGIGSPFRPPLAARADSGNDFLWGGLGDDRLHGSGGDDYINGGFGDDRLWGQSGNDTLIGWWGNDTLAGGLGDDVLNGGVEDAAGQALADGAFDVLKGGPGKDQFHFEVFWTQFGLVSEKTASDFDPAEDLLI